MICDLYRRCVGASYSSTSPRDSSNPSASKTPQLSPNLLSLTRLNCAADHETFLPVGRYPDLAVVRAAGGKVEDYRVILGHYLFYLYTAGTRSSRGDPTLNSHTLGEPASPFLVSIGWDEHVSFHFSGYHAAGLKPGRVARVDRISSMILTDNGSVRGEPSTDMLYTSDIDELPAVGDWVGILPRPRHDTDSIEVVLPRRSVLARARGGSDSRYPVRKIQVIAANVDFVFATHTAVNVNIARLVREVAQIEQSGSTPVVLLTKSDLLVDPSELLQVIGNTAPGLRVHLTSGLTGEGVDELRQYLTGNRTIVFIGASGVGKSTISNQLLGGELLATREVREYDGKGRHTTTARHLMPIPSGGVLIDTPGMRTFTLHNAEEGISEAFGDIRELAETCGFRDCRHEGDPGCAVQAAIAGGALNSERFDSFLKLQEEMQHDQSKTDKASYADDRTRMRNRTNFYKKNVKKREQ